MRKVLGMLRQFQQHTDRARPTATGTITTNLVITGKALMQIHGDWMKGEFKAAGKVAGKDFGCINIPGTKARRCHRRCLGLPQEQRSGESPRPQEKFAAVVVDPQV